MADNKHTPDSVYDKRKAEGICVHCGIPDRTVVGVRCAECTLRCRENQRRYASRNAEKCRAKTERYRKRYVEAGMCCDCGVRPIAYNSVSRCEVCLADHHVRVPKYVHRRTRVDMRRYLNYETTDLSRTEGF